MTALPHWTKSNHPELWSRSGLPFSRMKIEDLKARGLQNATLSAIAGHLPFGAHIGGGFLSNIFKNTPDSASDIDLFFDDAESFDKVIDMLTGHPPATTQAFDGYTTALSKTEIKSADTATIKFTAPGKKDIQLIKILWHDGAEHVIDLFDFTVCMFVTEGDNIIFNPMALVDLARNQLVIHRVEVHMDILYRLVKYMKKGYEVPSLTLDKITQEIVKGSNGYPNQGSPVRRTRGGRPISLGRNANVPY